MDKSTCLSLSRAYASATACDHKNESIVLCVYGPRGGTIAMASLDIGGARELIISLERAIEERIAMEHNTCP
jgi:hypothetical protein